MVICKTSVMPSLSNIKAELLKTQGYCFFCGRTDSSLDLAHLIRRSASTVHIENPLNCVLACRRCHDIFDNDPACRPHLPGFTRAMNRIREIDIDYYNEIHDKWTKSDSLSKMC